MRTSQSNVKSAVLFFQVNQVVETFLIVLGGPPLVPLPPPPHSTPFPPSSSSSPPFRTTYPWKCAHSLTHATLFCVVAAAAAVAAAAVAIRAAPRRAASDATMTTNRRRRTTQACFYTLQERKEREGGTEGGREGEGEKTAMARLSIRRRWLWIPLFFCCCCRHHVAMANRSKSFCLSTAVFLAFFSSE